MPSSTGARLRAQIKTSFRPSLAVGAALSAAALTVSPADAFGATHLAAAAQTAPAAAQPAAQPAAKPAVKATPKAVKAKKVKHKAAAHYVVPASMVQPLRALRGCESSNYYPTNTGNGFYGAYQFDYQTWHGLGFPGLPSDAPAWRQDKAAVMLHAQRGWEPWPACSRSLGLA